MIRHDSQDYANWGDTPHDAAVEDLPASESTQSVYWNDDEWESGDIADQFPDGEIEVLTTDDQIAENDSASVRYSDASEQYGDETAHSSDLNEAASVDQEAVDVIVESEEPDPKPIVKRVISYITAHWVAGLVASFVLHAWVFSTLSTLMVEDREYEVAIAADTIIEVEPPKPEPEQEPEEVVKTLEMANPDDVEKEQQTALNARSVGLIESEKPVIESAPQLVMDDVAAVPTAPVFDIPEGLEVSDAVVVQGTTGEGLIQLDAALDRVAWEIASNMKERKVLVVWLLDSSGSLAEQRKIVTKRMRRIYSELNALEVAGQIPNQDQPILSAVVTFGQGAEFLTPNPTTSVDEIIAQFEKAPMDQSGVENVFGAVRRIAEKWSNLRRRILVMTITDEAGDDFAQNLNVAISLLNKGGGRAYVIGPPAVFGKRQGFVPYLAPENGQTYQIPVDIGPESAMGDNVQLPFWFNGPQYENLSSGLGPYALARLVHETGGVYFMTNMTTAAGLTPTGSYSAQSMKLYAPNYKFGSPQEYLKDVGKHPIRVAVHRAHEMSVLLQEKYKALTMPDLDLRVNPNNYIQTLANAQQAAAVRTAFIDEVLMAFPPSLEQEYLKEESPRWRMSYNLSYGRLLAQKLRCMEYNTALAQLKLLGTQEITTKVNHFIFRPDPNINFAAGMKKTKDLSDTLLKRCVNEAPGTPWAVLAARELQYPLGIKVINQFDPPPPPRSEATATEVANARKRGVLLLADDTKKKKEAPAAPPQPPKLPKY